MRDIRFDSLRGMAMVGIVLIHVHSYFVFFHSSTEPVQIFTLLLANLSRFSVPVFILSAGFFLKRKSGYEYWKPKILAVLLPYIIIGTIGYFVKFNDYSLSDLVYRLILGKVFTPFYFIPLLFQFYMIYYLFFRREYNLMILTGILLIGLIINIASNLGWFTFLSSDYFIISPTNFIFFFLLGIYIRETFGDFNDISEDRILQPLFLMGLGIVIITLVYYTIVNAIAISNHTILYPCLFIVVYMGISWAGRYLNLTEAIGSNSMGIFLLHPFVIHFMHTFDPYLLGGGWMAIPIVTGLNIAIPLIIWKQLKRFISFL